MVSIIRTLNQKKILSIWEISCVLHVPLLILILGNGGGGPNYFFTFWISLVVACFEVISRGASTRPMLKLAFLGLVSVNFAFSVAASSSELLVQERPTNHLVELMDANYQQVSNLGRLSSRDGGTVLTNRNVGAFVSAGMRIENEGAIMFSYAWLHPKSFNREKVLERVQKKQYSYILSGLQPFPEDLFQTILANYEVYSDYETNLYMGRVGVQTIWRPKSVDLDSIAAEELLR